MRYRESRCPFIGGQVLSEISCYVNPGKIEFLQR